jgi:preprotein translocase subunit SecF
MGLPAAQPAKAGLASRLYRGEAGLDVVGRRRVLFAVAALVVIIAIVSFAWRGFALGIDFRGGNEFQIPASVGTLSQTQTNVTEAVAAADPDATVVSVQQLGGSDPTYLVSTSPMTVNETATVKAAMAMRLGLTTGRISDDRVSAAWGAQVTRQAIIGLVIFLVLVIGYLIVRFEWRMAVAAVASLVFDLLLTATVYSIVGFEISPESVIGFLTILGFALYDVVVVFDKIQENTRGITPRSNETYGEAANLAINQMLMRSINTGLVALLPVGGLLFIGAGLLGAGTLKDLGLVLFVGMGAAVYSSIFFATPVLVTLKQRQPKVQAHTRRVLARRNSAEIKQRAEQAALEADTALDVDTASGSDPEPLVTTANASARGPGEREPAKRAATKPAPTVRSGQSPARGGRRRH